METNLLAGIAIAVGGGILNGSFAVFQKYKDPWKWENFWLVWSFIALLFAPLTWIAFVTSSLSELVSQLSFGMIIPPMVFGMMFGAGAVLYGLSVERIGVGLTSTVVIGLSIVIGTITPLFFSDALSVSRVLGFLVAGLFVILLGIITSGRAGYVREKSSKEAVSVSGRRYMYGLFMAILSGIISPMINVGFAYGVRITEIAQKAGIPSQWAPFVTLEVVLLGGLAVNAGYAGFLLLRNGSGKLFLSDTPKPLLIPLPLLASIAAGLFWFGGLGFYAVATTRLGTLGTSVGYAIFMSAGIIASNALGVLSGEWKNVRKALVLQFISVGVLTAGIILVSLGLFTK